MAGKIATKVPDVLGNKKGKTVGGEGPGDRSIPGEAPTNRHDKNPGLTPISKKTVMTEKGFGGKPGCVGGGKVLGCGKEKGGRDSGGERY